MTELAQRFAPARREDGEEPLVRAIIEDKAVAESVILAKSYLGKAPGDVTKLASLLRKADDSEQAEIASIFKAHNVALHTARLFSSVGDNGDDATDEATRINKAATEFRKANPALTNEQAITKALENDPDAYEASISR